MSDVDKDTFIKLADNDELQFFIAGTERLKYLLMVISVPVVILLLVKIYK